MELTILVTGKGHIAKLPCQFKVKTENNHYVELLVHSSFKVGFKTLFVVVGVLAFPRGA